MKPQLCKIQIFRLAFDSYLKELGEVPTDEEKRTFVEDFVPLVDEHIMFLDGNENPVVTNDLTKYGNDMAFFRMEKKSHKTINQHQSHKENVVDDYPYFNVVLDFRRSTDYVLLGIEHKSSAFQSLEVVRNGLEGYFNEHFPQEHSCRVSIRPASMSHQFWTKLATLSKSNRTCLSSIGIHIPNIQTTFPLSANDRERLFLDNFMSYGAPMNARGGMFAYDFDEHEGGSMDEVKRHFDIMAQLACKNGFEVKAKLSNGLEVSSMKDAPAVYSLDRGIVGDIDDEKEILDSLEAKTRLAAWFDNIYQDLVVTEKEAMDDRETKRNIKK